MTDSSIPSVITDTTSPAAERPTTARQTRLDAEWHDRSAQYLQQHPEVAAAVPSWADEIHFSEIDDELEGTIFSFSKSIGEVELYGVGKVLKGGVVHLEDGGTPNVYLPNEIDCRKVGDISQWILDLARDLTSAASLLRSEIRLLRRPAEVDADLQRLDI